MEPGRIIEQRYVVERTIASGGMATVYVVRHVSLDSLHALKILHVPSPEIRERLLQEGRLQAKLRHPNIVAVTDILTVDNAPGLVMEYIDGPSLDDWLAKGLPKVEEAERIFLGILAAVDHAHRNGVVHRDLKPANVLLAPMSGGYLPKVADFGIAKVVADVLDEKGGGRVKTRSGVSMGTPAYMAPEQMESAGRAGPAADVFALGCILYDMMVGKPAFDGPHLVAILTKSREGLFDDPADVRPELPERIVEAIRGALAPELEDRIPTVAQLASVLTDGRITTLTGLTGPVDGGGTKKPERSAPSNRYPRGLGSDALRSKDTFRAEELDAIARGRAGPRPDLVPEGPTPDLPDREPRRIWLGILVPIVSLVVVLALGTIILVGLGAAAGATWWITTETPPPVEPVIPPVQTPDPNAGPQVGSPVVVPPDPPPRPPEPEPGTPEPKPAPITGPPDPKPSTAPEPKPADPAPIVQDRPTTPTSPPIRPPPTVTPDPAPTPRPTPAEPGAWSLSIREVRRATETRSGVFKYTSGAGTQLLVVDVTVQNGTDDASEPTAPFRLFAGGKVFESHLRCGLATPGAIASATEYPSGGSIRGAVCFEVPEGIASGEIRFYPTLGGPPSAKQRF